MTSPGSAGSVLLEVGQVLRTIPGLTAPAGEVAAWYRRKAELLDHVAADGGFESGGIAAAATRSRRRAEQLQRRAHTMTGQQRGATR